MKCPHCAVSMHANFVEASMFQEDHIWHDGEMIAAEVSWRYAAVRCPECFENVIRLYKYIPGLSREVFTVYPVGFSRPIPPEVGNPYRQDFADACAVLTISPKASAALSRRCLQSILKDKGRATKRDLNDQISELMGTLPSYIAEDLHAVRTIGNFAAHPIKSTSTGEIVDVEPGEAEWNIEVLESLFDFYFVQPALSAKRKAELNQKLKEAGKPTLS